jgi:hypothetical protein
VRLKKNTSHIQVKWTIDAPRASFLMTSFENNKSRNEINFITFFPWEYLTTAVIIKLINSVSFVTVFYIKL